MRLSKSEKKTVVIRPSPKLLKGLSRRLIDSCHFLGHLPTGVTAGVSMGYIKSTSTTLLLKHGEKGTFSVSQNPST